MVKQNKRVYLSSPHMSGGEKRYIEEAFATNWIAPLGPHVDAFEREVASFCHSAGAVAVSSGTAAIHLALKLAGVGPGDEVLCSTLTFIASVNPILYQGAIPVFVDSDQTSWNMSPEALKLALEKRTAAGKLPKAAVVVNLYGQSAEYSEIKYLCDEYGVLLIEDAAESMGATYQGQPSGTFGKFGIFSFNGNKIITTSGGGMLISDDLEALTKARFYATQAREPRGFYHHQEIGYNYRMSNILAGIGRGQLKVLPKRVAARRAVYERYAEAFSKTVGLEFMPELPEGVSTRWLTALTVDEKLTGIKPDQIIAALEEENIEARRIWKPMHLQPLFEAYDYFSNADDGSSVADVLFRDGICLPSGSNMTLAEQLRTIEVVRECLHKA
ncbi:aminotransferase class I/II-fold pyridoxal phosphate-dependent enzyme [uncultured Anaeromusa sp.]|uniref:DegT/DnrJ/EryC1/StrS family aminotransferase n=1 Tax=uncultured Anaeromusa sp. TaxID=673273 RepID=UPI0029C842C3|nr:aminotransferase class I/II-fold pyridoxal phosphate-dependent enzyme [uncultured Anaeromusa sp.]